MFDSLSSFLAHWAITALALWVASHVFRGLRFTNLSALLVSALLLGLANTVVRPLLIVLTLPLTFVTFGFFLLVINALMVQLVAALVDGFKVEGFWTAFFAAIFIAALSFLLGLVLPGETPVMTLPAAGTWL
ncbi:phage holin family protein [Denitratisoma sp. agr-D3]